jgi:hypothetical protein
MSRGGVPIVFAAILIYILWTAGSPTPTPIPQPAKPLPAIAAPSLESLFVSSATPTVVIVADLSSEYASRWISESAPKLTEKGWLVRSLDLEGSDEVRFYIRAQGTWRTHAGHMGLDSLRMMLGK